MLPGWAKSIVAGLGPLPRALPTPTNTAPLTADGILNLANLGTSPVKVLSGRTTNMAGVIRRIKLVIVTAGATVAWSTVAQGSAAPAITALGAGAATEGCLIVGGSGATEWFSLLDNVDLYLVASAAGTVINLTIEEV